MFRKRIESILFRLPLEFQNYQGATFLVLDGDVSSQEQLKSILQFYQGNKTRAERDYNRFFIFREVVDEYMVSEDLSNEQLVKIAEIYSLFLKSKLSTSFPNKKFEIEIIGDNGVGDEPLELCVTFSTAVSQELKVNHV